MVVQMLQDQYPPAGIGAEQCGHHGRGGSRGEPQRCHLAGVSLLGVGTVDDLLHHRGYPGQLNAPHT